MRPLVKECVVKFLTLLVVMITARIQTAHGFLVAVRPHDRQSIPIRHFTATQLLGKRGRSGNDNNKSTKVVKKENLPSKVCVVCGRPFTWRKKWERSWDEITTCSKRCNTERRNTRLVTE